MQKILRSVAILALTFTHAQAAPKLKVAGVQVVREQIGKDFSGLTPFNAQQKGSTLGVFIESSDKSIIELDLDNSKVTSFTDDKGTNLLIEKKGFRKDGFGPFPKTAKDGKAGMFEIRSQTLPAAGATALKASGTVKVKTASTKKAVKSAAFDPVKGTKVSVGSISMKIEKAEKPKFGDQELEIEFETSNNAINSIASVKFYDAAGKELESDSRGSSKMGFNNKYTYGRSYGLMEKPTGKIIVEFEMWTDLEETDIPFELNAGIGGD